MSLKDAELESRTECDAALEAGQRIAALAQPVQRVGETGTPFLVVPQGFGLHDLSAWLPKPLRTKAAPVFPDQGSFAAYVNRFKTADSVLFADQDGAKVLAILDYHGPAEAAHGEHTATLVLKLSEEWQAWTQRNRRQLGQAELADFLEERALDIREPSGGRIVDVVRNLRLKKNVVFEKVLSEENGSVDFRYVEDVKETGSLRIPLEWTLALRPYDHCEPVAVPVKVRYRLEDGKVRFEYRLTRPDLITETAFRQVVEKAREATALPTYYGKPK